MNWLYESHDLKITRLSFGSDETLYAGIIFPFLLKGMKTVAEHMVLYFFLSFYYSGILRRRLAYFWYVEDSLLLYLFSTHLSTRIIM